MRAEPHLARSARPAIDLERVRHPRERTVLALSALANVALVAAAVAAFLLAPEWLSAHPRAALLAQRVRGAGVAAILLVPALGFLRLGRWMSIELNAILLGPGQLPEVHAILEEHCRVLGIPTPALYLSALPSVGLSDALALRGGGRQAIVLGERLFDGAAGVASRREVLAFVLGHELGRIVLGHASAWSELLLGYLRRIPVLRLPLVSVETYSRDRMAALLAPDSVAALALMASGGEAFGLVDVDAFVRDALADAPRPLIAALAALLRKEPHLADRVRELHRYGFFDPAVRRAGD